MKYPSATSAPAMRLHLHMWNESSYNYNISPRLHFRLLTRCASATSHPERRTIRRTTATSLAPVDQLAKTSHLEHSGTKDHTIMKTPCPPVDQPCKYDFTPGTKAHTIMKTYGVTSRTTNHMLLKQLCVTAHAPVDLPCKYDFTSRTTDHMILKTNLGDFTCSTRRSAMQEQFHIKNEGPYDYEHFLSDFTSTRRPASHASTTSHPERSIIRL